MPIADVEGNPWALPQGFVLDQPAGVLRAIAAPAAPAFLQEQREQRQ
jgi:hypothetical protein